METNLGNPEIPRQMYLFNSQCLLVRLQKKFCLFPHFAVHTHEHNQREQGTQLQKNIKPADNLSVLPRKAQGSEPKHLRRKHRRTKHNNIEIKHWIKTAQKLEAILCTHLHRCKVNDFLKSLLDHLPMNPESSCQQRSLQRPLTQHIHGKV